MREDCMMDDDAITAMKALMDSAWESYRGLSGQGEMSEHAAHMAAVYETPLLVIHSLLYAAWCKGWEHRGAVEEQIRKGVTDARHL